VIAAVLLLLLSALVVSPGAVPKSFVPVYTDIVEIIVATVAALTAATAARRTTGRARWSWWATSTACASWAAGITTWSWYELARGIDTPFPSLADVGFLGFPLAACVALLVHPARGSQLDRGRRILDASLATSSLALVFWQTAFSAVVEAGADSGFALGVALAYPISDFLLLALVILTLSSARGTRLQLGLLATGMVAFSVSDSAFAYLTSAGSYDGGASDLGWIAGFLLIALSSVAQAGDEADESDRPLRSVSFLPYVPVAIAAVVLVVGMLTHNEPTSAQTTLIGLCIGLVLLRQYLTLRENSTLASSLAAREAQLRHQAFHDGLTGLANRALFQNRLEHALELHGRDLRPVSLLFLDLDDFKLINDTLGHAVGDELLVRVSERLRAALRQGDTVARLGGDEFAALLEDGGDPITAASSVAAALRPPFVLRGKNVQVGASIGVVGLEASDAPTTADALLAQADTAMYDAKRSGKGRLSVYQGGMSLPEVADTRTAAGLEDALAGGQLRLVYQPVVGLDDGSIDCLEGLSRWAHQGRDVLPETFLPAAIRTGVVGNLTDWAVDEACRQVAVWSHAVRRPLQVAVNIAGPQIRDAGLLVTVENALARHRLRPEQLVLDVTEASLYADLAAASQVVAELRRIGVRVALDDFGVGPSSVSQLHAVGVDIVKIDGSVIDGLDIDPGQVQLVRSLVRLGQDLGLQVVAEGVERPEQLDALLDLGCRYGQGHLLARPMDPVAVLETLVTRGAAAPRA
jgi:diguanylate cyclase (GGDEF)-like protein